MSEAQKKTKYDLIREEIVDLRLAIQRKDPSSGTVESSVRWKRRPSERDIKYHASPSGVSRTYRDPGTHVSPEHDLGECIRLVDIESYFAISVDRHVELIMKNGYELQGKNSETLNYVRRRIREIELMSRRPFADLLRATARNVVMVSNSFWVVSRDENRSSGRSTRMWGRKRKPISSVSIPDPSSITCRQTKSGNPSRWMQSLEGKTREWSHHDVIHIGWRVKDGFVFGTPSVIPVLEDIRALRKLEMLSEHVSHKHAFPLMHWKVGTEKVPADVVVDHATGLKVAEVDIANQYAEILAQEGYVVTSERHDIKIVGSEGKALDISPYIEHYRDRVLAGLRISQLDLGQGDTANRGTATALSQILVDACKEIQDVLINWLNLFFINELVYEGGYNLTPENEVKLVFPAIDTEEERMHQNHWLQMYVQNLVSREEARRNGLKLEDLTPEQEQNTFLNEHLIPLAKAEAELAAANSPAPAEGAAGGAQSKATKSASNKTTPKNQHGSKTKSKVPANDIQQIWQRAGQATVVYGKRFRDGELKDQTINPVFVQAQRQIFDTIAPKIVSSWHEAFEEVYDQKGIEAPAREGRDLHQVRELLAWVRSRDLQQVSAICMLQCGIEPRTGLPRESSYSDGSVTPAFQSSGILLGSRLGRALRAASVLGGLQAAQDLQEEVGFTDASGTRKLDYKDSEPSSSLLRCIAMSPKAQSSKLSLLSTLKAAAEEPTNE